MKTTASIGRWLALFVAAFILLSNGAQAQTTYNWAKLSGTGTGIVNDGVPQKLNWSWSPGGASISGTVNITRSGAGQHYVYSESQYATITGSGFYAPEYDGSTVAVNYGGVNGIYQFGSEGQYHRAPTDVSDSNPSTVTVDFSFATGQSSPQNTIISLFDPGSGANSGSFSYSVTAYLKGSRIDTSTWTLQVVDPYSPSSVNTGAYSWSAATATMTQTQFPIGSGGNFPDTLAFINTQNSVFDRLVLTASTVAVDNVAIGFGAATAPTLPVTLGKSWVNGATSDKVSLTLSGAGIQNATAGSSTAPSTTTQATAAGLAGKAVTITEAFSTGSAAGYSTAWKCTKDSDSTSVATGSGVTGNFTMPTNSGVTCAFTNTRYPSIRLSKALGGARFAANDNFSVAIRTGGASGTVVSATTAATTTGSGATVDAGTGTTGDYVAASGTTYTLTEAGTTGTSLANYTASLSCTDASGLTAAADLPANEAFDPAVGRDIKPADGAQLQCVVTNTPKAPISLQKALGGSGRIAASDQFALSATGNGAPAAVSTSGSGTAVTSGALAFNSVAGSTYTLDEAMSTGSTSTLSQYDQKLSCTNTGPTDVSGYTTLPSTLTPAVGDNISCVVTNTPKSTDGGSGGNPPSLICNGDPVIAGSDFTNAAWSKTGDWSSISAGAVVMTDDNGVARLIQAINGVTPGALVTFTWRFRNGIVSSGAAGNSVTVNLRYNGVEYWRGSTSQGAGSAPASAAQGGATCVSGCSALAADTDRVVQIRLPTSVPITGTLQLGASSGGGTSDDPQFKGPVSITNTGVCLVKKSIGGTGAFSFATTGVDTTMGGGGTTASITTTAVNTSVYYDASSTRNDNQPLLIKSPGASANVTITETPAPGFLLSGVSCTGVTPVLDAATNKITIANVPRDTVATCTVTNSTSIVNLSKALNGSRFATADQFSVAVRTGGVGGTVVSSSATATTTGSGATVTAGTGTTGDYYATPGQTFTLTEAAASGTSLANYNARLTCTDAAGVMAAASLPSNEVFDPAAGRAITPLAGANLRCTITNTAIPGANITLQKALGGTGRVVASDQFALSIKGSGTPVSINTTGTGTAITSAANTVTATPGTAYTLDEAMATGSGSSLSAYTRSVTCSNTGPTSVSALTTLPVSVTPAVGDAISCLITNTPAAATVSGRVFLDNGTGSGVANDGILNGSEAPQAGIAVRLTDCAATPTVYASALTDGAGGYSFGVPASVAVNAPLCVEQTNRSAARISTGASVGATALPSGTATAATGGSYTYTRGGTPDRIAFAWNGTGHANLNFGDVDNSGFAASSAKTAQPGSTVTYAHTFSAGTAGQARFGIASETATPALAGWSTQVFADPGCTGSLQPGAAQLYPPAGTGTAVAAGGKVCIVVKQFVPASAPQGANDKVTIKADFDYGNANPALSGSYVLDDITTVSDSVLELRKEVRNVTQGVTSFGVNNQAKSGDTLEYRITYTNNGAAPIGNMVVNDATPGYTSFVSATTGTTPATLTGCTKRTPANVAPNPVVACAAAQSAGGTGPIGWTFAGSVAPGGTGTVLFQVKID